MHEPVTLDIDKKVIEWLLSGDIAIQYQVFRDLLEGRNHMLKQYQQKIATEGWGARFMEARQQNGHWGKGLYQPKWTSTHYTLLDLKNLGFPPDNPQIKESVKLVLNSRKGKDGEINLSKSLERGDVCVNGMILNYASWFIGYDEQLKNVANFLLDVQMNDGGWNCKWFDGASHSSLHSTISVLEGLLEWSVQGDSSQLNAIANAIHDGEEFILRHQLFRSRSTGETIDPKMLRLSYPCRWHYDILRALDYFQKSGRAYDIRMNEALDILQQKRGADGYWPLQGEHKGVTHFAMETTGEPSRWNTLRALRVLKHFNISNKEVKT